MRQESQQLLQRATDCELRFDNLTRQLYATDASIYQVEPLGVAFPRNAADAASVIKACVDVGVPVIPRGAGTGLAGGALGRGLVVDFYRHNRQITELDLERRTVRVGAGVVLDQLNAFVRPYDLHFGPDVATSSRASLGGMIANNSSGAHVPVYGVTADHVAALEIVLADGSVVHLAGSGARPTNRASGQVIERVTETRDANSRPAVPHPLNPFLSQIAKQTCELLLTHERAIRERLPEGLAKRRPGYQFDRSLRRPGDLTQLIAGSEGTLAAIASAELKLVLLPRRRALGLIFFASVAEAMQATVELLDLNAAAIEHIDRLLFDQTRSQLQFKAVRDLLRLDDEPCESILLVEFFDDAVDKLAALDKRRLGLRKLMLRDESQQNLVWALRRAGLTLLTSRKGPAKPIAGIEDVAVHPEQLPEYVSGLQHLLSRLGLEASFYGHAAAGLLHVRPVIDLHTPQGVALFRQVADEVSALAARFRGSIAGEHGVGIARTEYLPDHLGPELMAASRELKAIFDPRNVMNPGKIVADGSCRVDADLRQDASRPIELLVQPTLGFVDRDESFVGNLEQCNGNGACLKSAGTMCPTYIVTKEEIMSTRGRANTIRAVLEGRLGPRDEALLSPELDEALRPCLACKACKSECPSNVDLAQLKAELTYAQKKRMGPSLLDRTIAGADRLGALGSAMAPLANAIAQSKPARAVMELVLGLDRRRTPPLYAESRHYRAVRKRLKHDATEFPTSGRRVVLWDDTWARYHEPAILISAVHVLEKLDYQVLLPDDRQCCGRPAFSRGLLDEAAAMGRHNLAVIAEKYPGLPVIFLEPSCLSMFIDDYRQLRLPGADDVAKRCESFESFVDRVVAGDGVALPAYKCDEAHGSDERVNLAIHAHCHAKALTDVGVIKRLAQRIPNANVTLLDTACCGMAGAFGMLKSNYDLSLQVAEPMLARLRALPAGTKLIASGTSCRHQIHDLLGAQPRHMAEILAHIFLSVSVIPW